MCTYDTSLSIRSLGKVLYSVEEAHDRNINAVAYLAEHCLYASAGQDKSIKVWNSDKANASLKTEIEWRAHDMPIMALDVSPD